MMEELAAIRLKKPAKGEEIWTVTLSTIDSGSEDHGKRFVTGKKAIRNLLRRLFEKVPKRIVDRIYQEVYATKPPG